MNTLKKITNSKYKFYFSGLLLIPLVLLVLPADFFDTGRAVCLSVVLFGKTCYGCGITRAVHHLIHLEFLEAYNFNKLVVIVFPLISYLYLKEIVRVYFRMKNN